MHPKSTRTLIGNIFANYTYALVMGLVTLAATPVYVRTLGGMQWGLVAICMTAQGVLLLLDAGLSQIMPREIARAAQVGRARQAYMVSLRLYGSIAIFACVVGQLFVSTLSDILVSSDITAQPSLVPALRLVLLQFLFQFPNNAAIAYWNGTEQQKMSNLRQGFFSASKHGAALVLVTMWQSSVIAYMAPFAIISAIEFFSNARRIVSLSAAPSETESTAVPISVRALIASAGGFSVAVILGMLTGQVDRFYLARTVSTELFGVYVLASNLALTLMHLQGPIQRAFFPRIVASGVTPWRIIWQMLGLLSLVCVLPCVVVALQAENILMLWLKDPGIAHAGAPVFRLIAIAVGLNGLYGGVYTLFLRDNQYVKVIGLNAVILVAQLTFLTFYAERLSIVAGGWTWLLCSAIQAAFGFASLTFLFREHHGN